MPKDQAYYYQRQQFSLSEVLWITGDEIKLQLRMRVTTEQINDHRPEFSNLRVSRTAAPMLQLWIQSLYY